MKSDVASNSVSQNMETIEFNLNGERVVVVAHPLVRLLDVLRESFGLTGVKEGCGEGECGACSVLLNGKIVNSCIVPIGYVRGKEIVTIEGYRNTNRYKIIEDSFVRSGAVQCGFCTPGFVMATEALFRERSSLSDADIREGISGNLCRCTGYVAIVNGIKMAVDMGVYEADVSIMSKHPDSNSKGTNSNSFYKEIFRGSNKKNVRCFFPKTIKEVVEIKKEWSAVVLAGGTDFMVRYKKPAGVVPKPNRPVIFLSEVDGLDSIKESDGVVTVGATVTMASLLRNKVIPPVLKDAVGKIAAPGVRNIATIVGNICNASPAGDSLPALYVLDTEIVVYGDRGERVIPIEDFIKAPGKTDLSDDEFVRAIRFKNLGLYRYVYRKVGTRRANALSKVSFVGIVNPDGSVRVAFGAVGPTVVRDRGREKQVSELLNRGTPIDEIVSLYDSLIKPIDDQRSTAIYRKKVVLNLFKKFLIEEFKNRQA